jgi:hypothetical protein
MLAESAEFVREAYFHRVKSVTDVLDHSRYRNRGLENWAV